VQHCCPREAVSITYCVCLGSIIYPACSTHSPYCYLYQATCTIFCILSHKRHDFRKKSHWSQNVCFYFLYTFCVKHFSLQSELSEIWSQMYIGLHVKWRLLLLGCNATWIFSREYRTIFWQTFTKSRHLFHAEGQTNGRTDRHEEPNVRFSQFCERATNFSHFYIVHECTVHIGRHEPAPDISILSFLDTN